MDTNSNAIQFIDIKEDGTIEMSSQAIKLLSSLKNQKIAITSINGPPQQNKTSFLNSFHESVLFNSNISTKGLWFWNSPIELENELKMLIIDTQGLHKDIISQKIFKLSILISTCFIYKTKDSIDSSSIDFLSFFTNDAHKIKIDDTHSPTHLEQLADYFPHFMWVTSVKPNKEADIYLEEILTKDMKKTFLKRNAFFVLNENDYSDVITFVKSSIQTKKIGNLCIDGNTLCRIVQNYIHILNDAQQSFSIYKSIEPILLSKGNNILENCFDNFKLNIYSVFKNKYPFNINNLFMIYNDLLDKETISFSNKVANTLTVKQTSEYLIKLYSLTRDELQHMFKLNTNSINKLLDSMYKDIKSSFEDRKIYSIDEMKPFVSTYLNDLYLFLNKFLELPDIDDINKNIIGVIISIFNDLIKDKLNLWIDNINDYYNNKLKAFTEEIERLNNEIKNMNEKLLCSNINIDKQKTDDSDLDKINNELKSNNEKLLHVMKTQENHKYNDVDKDVQNNQKNETYTQEQIQEKNTIISFLEIQIEKLKKDICNSNKEYTNKITELNNENIKLNFEVERLKGEKPSSVSLLTTQDLTLQSLFKGIQTTLLEFKESVDKLDKENETIRKKKFETSSQDTESKSYEWINEIKSFREEQTRNMYNAYEKIIKQTKNEIEELNFELTKKSFELTEQINLNKVNIEKISESHKKITEISEISSSKDKIIKAQNDNIKLLDTKINEYIKTREDLELKLNDSIVKFKMLEDEQENIFMLFDSVMTRKKDKFERDVSKLTQENQYKILKIAKQHKFIK